METIFQLSNLLVMPFWLLMIFLPHWGWTRRIMASPWVVAPAALLYALLVMPSLVSLLPQLANPQLGAIAALLGTPQGATIAWAHFLAFDLFVGRWAYLDSRQRGTSALACFAAPVSHLDGRPAGAAALPFCAPAACSYRAAGIGQLPRFELGACCISTFKGDFSWLQLRSLLIVHLTGTLFAPAACCAALGLLTGR